jgi:ABC-2 type transport system permease protein
MRNVWLIAKREYLERVRTKSFAIMTVVIPLVMLAGVFGFSLATRGQTSNVQIAIVAPESEAQFAGELQTELEQSQHGRMGVNLISPPAAGTQAELDEDLKQKDLDGYLWIRPVQNGGRPRFIYTPKSQGDAATKSAITQAIRTVFTREGLIHSGMSAAEAAALLQPVNLDSSQARHNDRIDGAKASTSALFFLMYFVILLYGMNVARSIIEEKTSRVFEVMLATVRPEEMLAGKVVGVGSVGLTQVAIWLVAAVVMTATPLVSRFTGMSVHVSLGPAQIIFFVVFFLLGFLLYSSIAASLGAMTNSEQELQQLNMFMVMPLAACNILFFFVYSNPDGLLPRIFSLVPFTSPLIMYMRISLKMPPLYEVAASIALLLASIYAILWVAARIYRVGILMYGKKPSLGEILRWLKYS